MTRIKKVVITAYGDECKLAIVESDLPDPTGSEVQLSVDYTIVSGSDVNMRRGTYPLQRKPPLTPGYSVIGKVRLNGKGCSKFNIGDCVACLSKYDGQAELINLPEKYLIRVPEGVDGKAAVALILARSAAFRVSIEQLPRNFVTLYRLPFGQGKRFLSNNNIVDRLVGGWDLSGFTTSTRERRLASLPVASFPLSSKPSVATQMHSFDPLVPGNFRVTDLTDE